MLTERTWEPPALLAAFERLLAPWQGRRLRFSRPAEGSEQLEEILGWCGEQSLRSAVPLPGGLGRRSPGAIGERLRPDWVSPAALMRLEELGLGEVAEERILGWVLDGTIPLPYLARTRPASPLLAAAAQVIRPTELPSAAALADLSALLYRHHSRMMRVAPRSWLARLEHCAARSCPRSLASCDRRAGSE